MRYAIIALCLLVVGCGEKNAEGPTYQELQRELYRAQYLLDRARYELEYCYRVDTIYLTIDRIETLSDTIYKEVKCDSH